MKYWFNRDSEKNNIVILTEQALLISSVDHGSMRSVNRKLELEVHPRDIFKGENLQVIPLDFLHSMVSCSTNPVLEINFSTKRNQKSETIGFTDFESKREFVAYFDALLARVNNNKLFKKEQRQPLHLTFLLPFFSLILGLVGIYLYFNQFRLLSITLGGLWVLSSLFTLLKNLIQSPKVVSWTNKGHIHPKICRSKYTVVAYSLLAVMGVTEFVSSFYLSDLTGPKNLYKSVQKKGVNYSIRKFLEAESNKTPLITALQSKDEELAVTLLNAGADTAKRYIGETALDLAIKNNLDKAVETMLNEKAPTSNNQNLLIRAVKAGGISHENLDKMMVIVDDINYKDENGLTALGNAIVNEREAEVIQCMLEMGASQEIIIQNMSPIEYTKKLGNKQISKLLGQY